MKLALVGGMDRLENHYVREAKRLGHELRVFNRFEAGLTGRIGQPDAVILFTGKVSHQVRALVSELAKAKKLPLYQYHSCGVCTLRECLAALDPADAAAPCRHCRN